MVNKAANTDFSIKLPPERLCALYVAMRKAESCLKQQQLILLRNSLIFAVLPKK
jgi:hypothetical protein